MAEHAGENPLTVKSVERISVGMADARRHDLDQNFARLGAFQIKLDNFQRLLGFKGYGGASLHGHSLSELFVLLTMSASGSAQALSRFARHEKTR
jgi:hypothetical protein